MVLSALKTLLADLLKLRDKKLAATVVALIVTVAGALIPGVHLTAAEVSGALTLVVGAVSYLQHLGLLKAKAARAAKRTARAK